MHNPLKCLGQTWPILAIPIFWFFLASMLFIGCKKQEDILAVEQARSEVVENFFKLPGSAKPASHQIAHALEGREKANPFLDPVLTRTGVPRWDHLLQTKTAKGLGDTSRYFLPLQSPTGEITAYIEVAQVDSSFRFILGEKNKMDTVVRPDKAGRDFYRSRILLLSWFEQQINKSRRKLSGAYRTSKNLDLNMRFDEVTTNILLCSGACMVRTQQNRDTVTHSDDAPGTNSMCEPCGEPCNCTDIPSGGGPTGPSDPGGVGGGGGPSSPADDWGGGGGAPTSGPAGSAFIMVSNILALDQPQRLYLAETPQIGEFLQLKMWESFQNLNPTGPFTSEPTHTYTPFPRLPTPEAIAASKLFLIAMQTGAFGDMRGEGVEAVLKQLAPDLTPVDYLNLQFYFSMRCAEIKRENPGISTWNLYWQASEDVIHLLLDGAGMIPGIGEAFDIANGLIYSLQGDGVNALISYSAAIPIVGWYASGARMASKLVTLADGSKTTYRWAKTLKNSQELIHFGERNQKRFRKAIGLQVGDGRIAHHIIPEALWDNPLVQRAAEGTAGPGGPAFHIDEALNGMPLEFAQHAGNHNMLGGYIAQLRVKLTDAFNVNPTMDVKEANEVLQRLIDEIKAKIVANPDKNIDYITY